MNARINPNAIAAAIIASDILTRHSCGHYHDQDARCIDVAAASLASQAIIAADDDFTERAAPLLDALNDLAFHSDALSGLRFDNGGTIDCEVQRVRWSLSETHKLASDALEELRGHVAGLHGVWSGEDPADIPLVTVERAAKERRGRILV